MQYRIRDAQPNDIAEIIRLCAEHAEFEQAQYSTEGKAEKLAAHLFSDAPDLFCLLVESVDGEVLGYATFMREFSTWDAEFYLHMDCLYLRPHARNRGIGEALMRAIAAQAKQLHCSQMQWQTPAFNQRALQFYERLGAGAKEKIRLYLNEQAMERL
jgi:ribosomal protein S18 acetylase RimI-like enzyme